MAFIHRGCLFYFDVVADVKSELLTCLDVAGVLLDSGSAQASDHEVAVKLLKSFIERKILDIINDIGSEKFSELPVCKILNCSWKDKLAPIDRIGDRFRFMVADCPDAYSSNGLIVCAIMECRKICSEIVKRKPNDNEVRTAYGSHRIIGELFDMIDFSKLKVLDCDLSEDINLMRKS